MGPPRVLLKKAVVNKQCSNYGDKGRAKVVNYVHMFRPSSFHFITKSCSLHPRFLKARNKVSQNMGVVVSFLSYRRKFAHCQLE